MELRRKQSDFFFHLTNKQICCFLQPFILYDSVYWIVDTAKEQCKSYANMYLSLVIHMQPVLWLARLFSVIVMRTVKLIKTYNECAVCPFSLIKWAILIYVSININLWFVWTACACFFFELFNNHLTEVDFSDLFDHIKMINCHWDIPWDLAVKKSPNNEIRKVTFIAMRWLLIQSN